MSDTSSVHQAIRETRYQDMVNNAIRVPAPCPMLSFPEPKTRQDFLELSCQLTLDLTTAYQDLQVSRDLKKVTHNLSQQYPDHPDRFECYEQILCKEALYGGRYYWEVEKSCHNLEFAVAYKTIGRKGWTHDCRFGYNKKSWSLQYERILESSVLHNKNETKISVPSCEIIAVYLDYPAGTLSFYAIANTMTLLHRFETTFTEPLYAGFRLRSYTSSVILC
ncbi:tripartite motif-containing protein 16-like [Erpetoichthys calabaricus]|uniref:tripartite motif-containing protein 16-like n=1 Tax=Erpetoichthys calabaricus TaxID=27687 RepID=UPI002234BBAF|nr:tripartite motif-containing protein 16-like [Erpetoichthys calabaricus]